MQLYQGDCLEVMKQIPDKSVDMILCDLPYGSTQCKWDNVIPFDELWTNYNRVIKENGAIVLFGSEPFSSYLRILNSDGSMINNLRYVTKADCINCDFMQAKEIDNKVKKIIRQYADSQGISILRKHGWVDFTRIKPYKA